MAETISQRLLICCCFNPVRFSKKGMAAAIDHDNVSMQWNDFIMGVFVCADTIVKSPGDPQTLTRYTYCLNNPLIYVPADFLAVLDVALQEGAQQGHGQGLEGRFRNGGDVASLPLFKGFGRSVGYKKSREFRWLFQHCIQPLGDGFQGTGHLGSLLLEQSDFL
jgi:hypothetical protein